MNREEAKYYLQSSGFSEEQIDTIEKAFTSTDAISRQAVLDIVDSYSESRSNVEDVTQDMISDILALPPVTPQPKIGHWITDAKTYYEELNKRGLGVDEYTPYFTDDIACSECLAKYSMLDNETQFFKHCPNCGAWMVEPQESEG